jgi:hypothetical protein
MKNIFKALRATISRKSHEQIYLEQATSLADLERRQRNLTYGRADFCLPHPFNYTAKRTNLEQVR